MGYTTADTSMHTHVDAETSSDAGVWPAAPLTRALELLAEGCGVTLQPREAWEAAAEVIPASDEPITALGIFGLAARRARLVVSRPIELWTAAQLHELGPPALSWLPGPGGGRWLVLLGQRGAKLELTVIGADGERPMSLSAVELERWLRAETRGHEQLRWARVEPLLPLARIESGPNKLGALRRLLALASLEREDLGVVLVYAVAVGGMSLVAPVAVQALVNTVAFGSVLQPLVVLSLLLALGLGFVAILRVLQAIVVEALQQRLFVRTAADFARRLPRLAPETRRHVHAPELANRLFDVVTLHKAGATLLTDGLALVLQMAVGMALLAFYHPLLLAFDLVLLGGVMLVVFVAGRGAIQTSLAESDRKYAVAAWLEDIAATPLRFADAHARAFADARAELLIREWVHARRRHFARILRQLGSGVGLQVVANTVLLGLGGWLVIRRQLTLGQLVAAELVVGAIGVGLGKLGKHLETFYDATAAAAKIGKVVDAGIELGGGELARGFGPLAVVVEKRGDDRSIELALAPGEKLGLVGRTAAHSRLLDELYGLAHDPSLDLRVDGCSLRELDLEAYRSEVALVRGFELVASSIRDNLDPRTIPSDGAVLREALEIVGLRERIAELPDGLLTPMLPSGAPLCEAEARRLMLAAALVRRPRLLLIDGGLDGLGLAPELRARLLDHLLDPDAPWTLVVSSEDPEILRRCTRRKTPA